MTSLGMTGAFTTTAAVGGAAGGVGIGTLAYTQFKGFEKDAKKIEEIIDNRENPMKIIELIQYRKPIERFMIRIFYNNIDPSNIFGGTWESITSPIDGAYFWKRIEYGS